MIPPKLVDLCPSTTIREIITPTQPGWSPLNPSIAYSPQAGYACIVRTVNYSMDVLGRYVSHDPDGYIRTINYFCRLDDDLNVVSMYPIEVPTRVSGEILFPPVQGMEDARLFWSEPDKMWHAYGTVRYHREDGNCEIAEDRIVSGWTWEDSTKTYFAAVDRTIYPAPVSNRAEKNWIKLGSEFIYSFNPYQVYNPRNGKVGLRSDTAHHVPDVRGSSQTIYNAPSDQCLAVVHSVYYPNNSFAHRAYEHRFVVVRDQFQAPLFSQPFFLHSEGIEFVAGIVEWHDCYAISFGSKDSRALLAIVKKDEVHALLD
jgi:hypothetical protein